MVGRASLARVGAADAAGTDDFAAVAAVRAGAVDTAAAGRAEC